jgi:hypothetical protein
LVMKNLTWMMMIPTCLFPLLCLIHCNPFPILIRADHTAYIKLHHVTQPLQFNISLFLEQITVRAVFWSFHHNQ